MCRRLLAAVAVAAALQAAAAPARLTTTAASVLVLEGRSNVAAWRCSGRSMTGEMTIATTLDKVNEVIDRVEDGNIGAWMSNPAAGQFTAPQFTLSIPIASLRCGGGRPMERDLMHALKGERFPSIEFHLDGVRGPIEHDLDEHLYRSSIGGRLSLAGSTRTLTLPIAAERLTRTRFRLRAELPVHMSDFGVTPPTAMFGLIKADDALTVRFDLVLEAVP